MCDNRDIFTIIRGNNDVITNLMNENQVMMM